MSDKKFESGLDKLAPLARELEIDLDVLGDLLMLFPVGEGLTDTPISSEILLTDEQRDTLEKLDAGADQSTTPGADELGKFCAALTINKYFLEVAAHAGEYAPTIRKNIDELTKDKKPGETLEECARRNLKKYNLTVVLVPAEPPENIFAQDFAPILNNAVTNEIVSLNPESFTPIPDTPIATFTSEKGTKYTIKNFDKFTGNLSTGAKKLFYAALLELTNNNVYRTPVRRATVELPLIEYGEAIGKRVREQTMSTPEEQAKEHERVAELLKKFKRQLRGYLDDIKSIEIDREETRGYHKGDYRNMSLISSHAIKRSPGGPVIEINFDVKFAQYFNNSYVSWFPTALFKCDNRNPNEFSIGCKFALQNSIDNNVARGTDTTLTVKTLIKAAPECPNSPEAVKRDTGRDDGMIQIKGIIERSLNGLVKIGYFERWNYRDAKTGKTFKSRAASRLSWSEYVALCVDVIILPDNPQREQRTRDRIEAKQTSAEGAV